MNNKYTLVVLLAFCSALLSAQKFKELAATPPMGWNSWNYYNCNINETKLKYHAMELHGFG